MADTTETRRYVTSVLVPDRVGLLRDVTQAVLSLDGNIGHIRQTVVNGFFHLIFTSEHPEEVSAETLRSQLSAALPSQAVVTVLDCPETHEPVIPIGSRFVVSTSGKDKPGTIFAITSFLVEHGINIEDWVVEEDNGKVVYIAQVVVPEEADFRKLQASFKAAMAKLNLVAVLCHENIFRATNEIGPIKSLLEQ
jgi:predicted amino acid-binding ACT domain protein